MDYPRWCYFPKSQIAPQWAISFCEAIAAHQASIDSVTHPRFDSNEVLEQVRPSLQELGWQLETGKTAAQKLRRPVLFGDQNEEAVSYDIDGWHPEHGVVLEIESGRGIQGGAFYRDLIRASLIHGAHALVIGLRTSYSYGNVKSQPDYERGRAQLDAIYASGRLSLPFDGVLLFGW